MPVGWLTFAASAALAAAAPFPGARAFAGDAAQVRGGGGGPRLRIRAPKARADPILGVVEVAKIRRAPLARRQAVALTSTGALTPSSRALLQLNVLADASSQNATGDGPASAGKDSTGAATSTANASGAEPEADDSSQNVTGDGAASDSTRAAVSTANASGAEPAAEASSRNVTGDGAASDSTSAATSTANASGTEPAAKASSRSATGDASASDSTRAADSRANASGAEPAAEASSKNATGDGAASVGKRSTSAATSTANASGAEPMAEKTHKESINAPSAPTGAAKNLSAPDAEAQAKAAREEMNSLKLCEDSPGVVMKNSDGVEMTCAQVKPFCKFLTLEVQTKCTFTCGFCGGKKALPPVTSARKAARMHLTPPTVAPFVCADAEDPGFELKLSGTWGSASCGQLVAYCQSPLYGKDVSRRCPVTCVRCVPYSASGGSPPCEDTELVGAGTTAEGLPLTCQHFKPFCDQMSMHARVQCPKTCGLCRPLNAASRVQEVGKSACVDHKDPGLAFAFRGNLTQATCADLQPYCADMSQGLSVLNAIHAHCPETCGICGMTAKATLSNFDQSQRDTTTSPAAASEVGAYLGKDDEDPTLPPAVTTPEPDVENSGPSNFIFEGKASCTTRRRVCGFCACRRRDSPPNGLCQTPKDATHAGGESQGPVSASAPEEDEDSAEACPNIEDG